ncbi:MAG: hypothetical protein U0892_03940 [Pirellulales bacterium]
MGAKKIAEQFQVDGPLVSAIGSRIWQAISGPITILLLIRSLTQDERGTYYALAGILSIQMFFELGLLNLLVSQTGHLMAVAESEAGRLRMASMIRSAMRWFTAAGLLFGATAWIVGYVTVQAKDPSTEWTLPYTCMVIASALTVAYSPAMSILEGAGYRESVYRSRLLQMMTGHIAVWTALALGLKYWALACAAGVQLFWTLYPPFVMHAEFFRRFRSGDHSSNLIEDVKAEREPTFSWMRDVVPLQWRVALISAIYHFATQFFAIIVYEFDSKAEGGRLGMTLSVTGAIQSMALAWIYTKFSTVAQKHGQGEREEAGTMWRRTLVVSLGLLTVALTTAIGLVAALPLLGRGWETGFISPAQMAILAVGCISNHVIATTSFYVLARKDKPFMFPTLFGYSITAACVWLFGYLYSTTGVVSAYSLTMTLITLPLYMSRYSRYRKK